MNLFLQSRVLPVLAGAGLLVGAANLGAYAADGHPFLLGRANDESHGATVTNHGPGPALSLTTRDGTPPLEVSSPARVQRLNADRVDGLNGGTVTAYTYRLHPVSSAASLTQRFPLLPPGRTVLVSYWLGADMTTSADGLGCQIDNNTLHGVPDIREVALSASRQASLVANAASGVVSTRGRGVDLACFTDSGNPTIDTMFAGAVTFVPVGRSVQRTAVTVP
jgi:hypothetical protein